MTLVTEKPRETGLLPESRWMDLIAKLKKEIEFRFEIEDLKFGRVDRVVRILNCAND